MNCPGHCLIYKNRHHSYRDLPIRYLKKIKNEVLEMELLIMDRFADFGALHRDELSGTLTGLTRVRRFQQDDAHIFAAPDMVEEEIKNCLSFMKHVYGVFGFDFKLTLSTRPAVCENKKNDTKQRRINQTMKLKKTIIILTMKKKYIGEVEMWDKAEKALTTALKSQDKPYTINEGDGAFYGPKIDVYVMDAIKRPYQCATIQLDFQLPIKFNLEVFFHNNYYSLSFWCGLLIVFYKYTDEKGQIQRPVMIHRAILGSVERMMAVLIEHTSGRWYSSFIIQIPYLIDSFIYSF